MATSKSKALKKHKEVKLNPHDWNSYNKSRIKLARLKGKKFEGE